MEVQIKTNFSRTRSKQKKGMPTRTTYIGGLWLFAAASCMEEYWRFDGSAEKVLRFQPPFHKKMASGTKHKLLHENQFSDALGCSLYKKSIT